MICEFYGGNHLSRECQVGSPFGQPEQANYVNNFQRGQGNPYSNTCTPAWQNHPNFSWSNNNVLNPPPEFQAQEKKSNLEDVLSWFIDESSMRLDKNDILLQNQVAFIRNLEVQTIQIHNMLFGRTQGALPSNTKKNPKEQVQAIILRSGKQLEQLQMDNQAKDSRNSTENEEIQEEDKKSEVAASVQASRGASP